MSKTKKRLLSVWLAVLMLLAAVMFVIPAAGVKAAWDGTAASSFAGGSGTEAEPYLISNANELALLAEKVNDGDNAYNSGSYKLIADINVSGNDWTAIGIGDGGEAATFSGIFDGNHKVISGININKPDEQYQGLFGVSRGTIKNVGIENSSIVGKQFVGGVCGHNIYGAIEGCYNAGNVKATDNDDACVGGICGESIGSNYGNTAKITNCYNTGTVEGTRAGGICGSNNGGDISYCYNAGKVVGSDEGAICAMSSSIISTANVTSCYYSKDICSVDGVSASDGSVQAEGISTEELCGDLASLGFDETVWTKGTVGTLTVTSGNNAIKECTLPSLTGVGEAKTVTIDYYDFGFYANNYSYYPDWQTYTPITTAAELQAIGSNSTTLSGNYVMKNDITLPEGENNFTPIGTYNNSFTGKFSGDDHTVSGININVPLKFQGLFGNSVRGSIIKNVTVADSSISGTMYVGGICGDAYMVENCTNYANVNASDSYAGGICGAGQTTINCVNGGNVNAPNGYTGGIAGRDNNTIRNCYNTGKIGSEKSGGNIGGICGRSERGPLANCYNTGDVLGNSSSTIGGISGSDASQIIEYCFSTGKVISTSDKSGSIGGAGSGKYLCYYSTDFCKLGAVAGSDVERYAEGKTTAWLCGDLADLGYDDTVWEKGSIGTFTVTNGNFGIQEYILPSLKGVGTAQTVKVNVYNFGVGGKDEWQTYTPIKSVDELEAIGNDVTALSGNYVLMNDIDVVKDTGKTENNWTPIGNLISDPTLRAFKGKFSGDGHVISGININEPNESYLGLFKNVGPDGVVKNVGLTDGSIYGSDYVGGICPSNEGTIENCFSSLEIKAHNGYLGGICADNVGTINKCFNTGNISGRNNGGGICGRNIDSNISNSYNIGNIEVYYSYSGGICGDNFYSGSVKNCYNAGTVLKLILDQTNDSSGSICGSNVTGKIANCYYSKNICSNGGIDGSDEAGKAEGISTEELCNITALPGFESDVWENGSVISVSDNGRMREAVITFPHLKNVGEQQTKTVSYYNFGIDGKEDWQTYTPVTTLEDLDKIGYYPAHLNGNYVLMNDIIVPAGENNYVPNPANRSFNGKFSGDGHVISGININKPDENDLGLFRESYGLIMELGITNSSIIGKEDVGAICGENQGTIWGCYSTENTIESIGSYAGGICGRNWGGNISKCYNTSDVSGGTCIGGIAGYNQEYNGIDIAYGNITNCYNTGKLTSDTDSPDIGGITSANISGCVVSDCYNTGSIVYSGDRDGVDEICINGGTVTNCYYNTDFCTTESSCGTGLATLEMVSGKMNLNPSVWTNKPVDKAAKTAYYPALAVFGNDNPISYETKLNIALSPDSETVYGGDYSFDISALVKFDGMTEFRADKTALTTGCGKYTVVCGDKTLCTGDIYDKTTVTATYSGKDIPRDIQTITLKYDGTGSVFFISGTASLNADVTHTHTISEGYSYDETSHWKTCSGCDDKINFENHSFDEGVITGQSTNGTEDEKTYTCKVCGYKKIENTDHRHKPSEDYSYDETNHWKTCSGCDEKLDLEKHSFDGGVIITPATKETEGEMVYTCTVCGYKKTEIIGKLAESYPIVISGEVTANKSNAEAGENIDVSAPFGYDIIVSDVEDRQIAKITEKGSFKMPASGVVITAVRGEMFAHMTNAWNHSYVYSYDSDMNRIKVNSDAKRGVITIDLGAENAGRSFIIYSGRKSTSKKITEGVLDENGRFTFSADEGRNYTLIVK